MSESEIQQMRRFSDQRAEALERMTKERDRLRDALKKSESPCTCGMGRFAPAHGPECVISLRIAALKGETK